MKINQNETIKQYMKAREIKKTRFKTSNKRIPVMGWSEKQNEKRIYWNAKRN